MKQAIHVLAVCAAAAFHTAAQEERLWNVGGRDVRATMLEYHPATGVKLKSAAGNTATFPLEKISRNDRKYTLRTYAADAVVMVENIRDGEEAGFGSGFMVGNAQFLLTNYHVVRGAEEVRIVTRDERKLPVAGCAYVDQARDVALLRLAEMSDLPILQIHPGAPPETGEPVWTIGHPRGFKDTVSWGEVNALRMTKDFPAEIRGGMKSPEDTRYIQTDAVILHGSSGSPLMDERGRVIGINSMLLYNRIGLAVQSTEFAKRIRSVNPASDDVMPFPLPPSQSESPLDWYSPPVEEIDTALRERLEQIHAANRGKKREELDALFQPEYQKAFESYRDLLQRGDLDAWTRLQGLFFAVQAYIQLGNESTDLLDQAVRYLSRYHPDSVWLGSVAVASAGGIGNQRFHFLKTLAKAKMSDENRKLVLYAIAMNCMRRMEGWEADPDIDLKDTRVTLDAARAQLQRLAEAESGADPEAKDPILLMLDLALSSRKVGKQAEEIVGKDAHGKTTRLSDYKGKVVLLDFFANWCPHCRVMYGHERQMMQTMKERPFVILGVNADQPEVLKRLVDNKTVTWPSIADGRNGPIGQAWGVRSYPTLYIIDHEGVVRHQIEGRPSDGEIDRMVEALVLKAEKAQKK